MQLFSHLLIDCSDLVFTDVFLELSARVLKECINCITSFHIKMLEIINIYLNSIDISFLFSQRKTNPREKRYMHNCCSAEQE